jgi:hypothetical protein
MRKHEYSMPNENSGEVLSAWGFEFRLFCLSSRTLHSNACDPVLALAAE